jgi:hypothetical protein
VPINLVLAVTDADWFEQLRRQPDLAEVNFWAPSAARFRALQPGELFLFKLHAPRNVSYRTAPGRTANDRHPPPTVGLLAETTARAARQEATTMAISARSEIWLRFLKTYRTMCLAPSLEFRLVLQQVRDLRLTA